MSTTLKNSTKETSTNADSPVEGLVSLSAIENPENYIGQTAFDPGNGHYLGKLVSIEKENGKCLVKTDFGKEISRDVNQVIVTNASENTQSSEMSFKEVKKLYYISRRFLLVPFILGLGILYFAYGLAGIFENYSIWIEEKVKFAIVVVILTSIIIFLFITYVGSIKRTSWGRVMMMIVFYVFIIIKIPFFISPIFAIIGFFEFRKSKALFGENRITHTAIKKEFKSRKVLGK
ncbi:MAG TPA: hypothetical protein PLK90_02990 [Clostridiales bacterium]|nr:hypothetical protein [Clostridiales bacterium]HQP69345.1 hypothetical protein [Clostridiales bacterium]